MNTPASSSTVEAVPYGSIHKSHKSANRPQCDGVDVSSVLKNGTMERGKANSRIDNDASDFVLVASCR